MLTIMKKTYSKMFTVVPVVLVSVLSVFAGYFLAREYRDILSRNPTYSYITGRMTIIYALFTFLMIAGLVIWIITANVSSGLFANELHEGTLRLLLAKPIGRKDLVLGKVIGMFLGSMTYLALSLILMMSGFCLFSPVDKDVLSHLLKYTMIFFMYGTLMIFISGAIGSFLSTCFKKKVPALLILLMIGIFAFAIFPIIRLIISSSGIYYKFHLYYIDINYHFGLIFHQFTQLLGEMTTSQGQLELFSTFTNIFKYVSFDTDITLGMGSIYALNTTLNGIVVTLIYTLMAVVLYALTFKRMFSKDIS